MAVIAVGKAAQCRPATEEEGPVASGITDREAGGMPDREKDRRPLLTLPPRRQDWRPKLHSNPNRRNGDCVPELTGTATGGSANGAIRTRRPGRHRPLKLVGLVEAG
jgi:hypothetical protein